MAHLCSMNGILDSTVARIGTFLFLRDFELLLIFDPNEIFVSLLFSRIIAGNFVGAAVPRHRTSRMESYGARKSSITTGETSLGTACIMTARGMVLVLRRWGSGDREVLRFSVERKDGCSSPQLSSNI